MAAKRGGVNRIATCRSQILATSLVRSNCKSAVKLLSENGRTVFDNVPDQSDTVGLGSWFILLSELHKYSAAAAAAFTNTIADPPELSCDLQSQQLHCQGFEFTRSTSPRAPSRRCWRVLSDCEFKSNIHSHSEFSRHIM